MMGVFCWLGTGDKSKGAGARGGEGLALCSLESKGESRKGRERGKERNARAHAPQTSWGKMKGHAALLASFCVGPEETYSHSTKLVGTTI